MRFTKHVLILILLTAVACSRMPLSSRGLASRDLDTGYQYINTNEVLFGVEYSFQDRELVNEPGRTTMRTDHKAKKLEEMFNKFLELKDTTREEAIVKNSVLDDFKPGYQFKVPGDGVYTINMEPVTVEFNTTPKTAHQIVETSTPIFEAAEAVGLKPYVNPAAERSGMGHIHVGGNSIKENPFYKNPNLLRNILVYYHKHPSLLYGFAEAYDIGDNSNIETYHNPKRQKAFEKAIAEFDAWYEKAQKGFVPMENGLQEFLLALKRNEPAENDFFHHYRFINLEHLKKFTQYKMEPELRGKYTVEFRIFRPQKGPEHALANTQLLLDVMETLSAPGYLEKFEPISETKFNNFWTVAKIKSDWLEVKKFIKHDNEFSDEMLEEAVDALETRPAFDLKLAQYKNAKVYSAYSKKTDKGTAFELRIPAKDATKQPDLLLLDKTVEFELVTLEDGKYWIATVDTKKLNISLEELLNDPTVLKTTRGFLGSVIKNCQTAISSFF